MNTSNGIAQDTTVVITSRQLKETNLIFVEHKKLLVENELLLKQVDNYKYINSILLESDSIRATQLDNYKGLTKSYTEEISKLNKEIKKKRNYLLTWKIGGITVSTGLLLLWLLK